MHSYPDINAIPKKYYVARIFLQDQDPGNEFEMSSWIYKEKHVPDVESSCLVLVKMKDGEIFKAIYFPMGFPKNWCTWEEGYSFSGKAV